MLTRLSDDGPAFQRFEAEKADKYARWDAMIEIGRGRERARPRNGERYKDRVDWTAQDWEIERINAQMEEEAELYSELEGDLIKVYTSDAVRIEERRLPTAMQGSNVQALQQETLIDPQPVEKVVTPEKDGQVSS